jgi:phage-related minor tail protein
VGVSTAREAAESQLRAAANAERHAIALLKAAVASDTLTASKVGEIRSLAAEATAFRVSSDQIYRNEVALARHARTSGQVTKGLAATSAGFFGLRGAVLAASLPFLAATIALTGFAKTVGQAGELQRSLREFQAVSGATAQQLTQVRGVVRELGADLTLPAVSANDAAKSLTELSKAGLTTEDSIDAVRGSLQLAVSANIEVGDAAEAAASQLNAFGLAGDQASRVTNLLAGASIAAQGEIGDFIQAFAQVSATAKQSGLSIEQTAALLAQLARAGLQGGAAGTALRVMLTRICYFKNRNACCKMGNLVHSIRVLKYLLLFFEHLKHPVCHNKASDNIQSTKHYC